MGLLVDGKWQDQWYDTSKTGGKFEREAARFRNWVTAEKGAFQRNRAGITCTCPWRVPGPIGR